MELKMRQYQQNYLKILIKIDSKIRIAKNIKINVNSNKTPYDFHKARA